MHLNVLFNNKTEFFSVQKMYVDYSYIQYAFRYALIPIANNLKCLCEIIPKKGLQNDFCLLDSSVVQFTSFLYLSEFIKSDFTVHHFVNNIHSFKCVVEAKCIDVTVVFKNDSDISKWKSSEELIKTLKDILLLYTVVNSCLITSPKSKFHDLEIIFICVHDTKSKRCVSRITSSTIININEVMSLRKFEMLCSNPENFKVAALSNQYSLLDSIYNARLNFKQSKYKVNLLQKILLIGPSGCGKTRLVKYFANIKKCPLMIIEGFQLLNSKDSESNLISLFNEAQQRSEESEDICIIFLDNIDSLCRKNAVTMNMKQISKQLIYLIESVQENCGIMIIAATNNIHLVDSSIRCGACLEIETYIGVPSKIERQEILQLCCHNQFKSSLLENVASYTPGYVGSDLSLLIRDVYRMQQKNPVLYKKDFELLNLFKKCILKQVPSSLRSNLLTNQLKNISINDLGGLKNVKIQLKSYIEWPIQHPESFQRLGIPVPKGILLYGPPGCAKTSLACAIAQVMSINFINVSSADMYSPFVGEAEKNIIELFSKARSSCPCIIFIDEIEALVGNRNSSNKNVQTNVLSTFLTEMDGVGCKLGQSLGSMYNNTVMVIAATNRLDKIDSALLRPGRFDKHIYVGPPDFDDRIDILRTIICQKKIPVSSCVDFSEISKLTNFFTGSDLVHLIKEAGYNALMQDGMSASCITQKHIMECVAQIKPSLQKD